MIVAALNNYTLDVGEGCGLYIEDTGTTVNVSSFENYALNTNYGSITYVGESAVLNAVSSNSSGIFGDNVNVNTDGTGVITVIGGDSGISASMYLRFNRVSLNGSGNFNIAGDVSSNVIHTYSPIMMSDSVTLNVTNNQTGAETHNFVKTSDSDEYYWKLTNTTIVDPLTGSSIEVAVAAGATGTIERVAPIKITSTASFSCVSDTGGSFGLTAKGAVPIKWDLDGTVPDGI